MNSFIPWIGGKKLLRERICNEFPENFNRYVEVFGGAGWVLFHKDKHAKEEIYNDVNGNLINLFKCVKYHPEAIEKEMQFLLNSREIFEDFKSFYDHAALTDIQRAVKYLYLIKLSYGAKGKDFSKPTDLSSLEYIHKISERLKRVIIENRSYDIVLKKYDKEDTLFYCDPPYYKTEKYYDTEEYVFDENSHIHLHQMLSSVNGKFILSYNDDEFIRNLYKDFNIFEVTRANNLVLKSNAKYKELIIKNY